MTTVLDIDIRFPVLYIAAEVDPNLANSKQLERLLRMYGLPVKGTKEERLDRILNHLSMGKGTKIDPAFEGGKWHQKKRFKLMGQRSLGDELPLAPLPGKAWKPFPSVHIPEGYTKEKINSYFNDIPSLKFSYQDGVVTATPQEVLNNFHDDTSNDDESEDEVEIPSKDFTYLCQRAIKKCIKKGEQFLNSGRVLSVFDIIKERHYFVKAQVQASMEATIYVVMLTLNVSDGCICGAECSCKAQSLQRCGHIAAVAIMLWEHVRAEGYEAVTTTGRQCYWRKGAPKRNPGLGTDKEYTSRKSKRHRIAYDPTLTAFKQEGPINPNELNRFKQHLQVKTPTCLLLYHLEAGSKKTEEGNSFHIDESDEDKLAAECVKYLKGIEERCSGQVGPFEVPNTRGQQKCQQWYVERSDLINASSAKSFLGLRSERRKIKFLRQKIWGLDKFETAAMKQGKINEDRARKEYEEQLKGVTQEFRIEETGLWKNPKYPEMACSPDGFIIIDNYLRILLEIKVLTVLRQTSDHDNPTYCPVNPNNFEEEMTPQQKRNFYLKRNEKGDIILKPSHPYHYQIQMSLDLLELDVCHLLVWSESGHMVVLVDYDAAFWQEKRFRLLKRHRELIVPEILLGRTKRWLPPLEVTYEDMNNNI